MILKQGDTGARLFIIISGYAVVTITDPIPSNERDANDRSLDNVAIFSPSTSASATPRQDAPQQQESGTATEAAGEQQELGLSAAGGAPSAAEPAAAAAQDPTRTSAGSAQQAAVPQPILHRAASRTEASRFRVGDELFSTAMLQNRFIKVGHCFLHGALAVQTITSRPSHHHCPP